MLGAPPPPAPGTFRSIPLGSPPPPFCDNSITTSKYTRFTFLPISLFQQFRRLGNMYFLVIGIIMAAGYYGNAFPTAVSPWTTLGPLALVVSISLLNEGITDARR